MPTPMTPALSVYLVMAETCYEGSTPVAAYAAEADAVKFAEVCSAYACTRPKPPEAIEDTPWNDAQWVAFDRATKFWQLNHPAGAEYSSRDFFSVLHLTAPSKTRAGSV